jgi:hypothetical protein
MFGLFKRKKKCRHYKKVGESYPDNMRQILRFSPYAKDSIGYTISECAECGTRAFGCIGLHMMGPDLTGVYWPQNPDGRTDHGP